MGVANVVVQEGEFQSSSDRSLASLFDNDRHQGGNDNHFHYSSGRHAYIPRSVSLQPHSIQRDSNERNHNAYHACGDQRLEDRRRTKSEDILAVLVEVGQLMLIGLPAGFARVLAPQPSNKNCISGGWPHNGFSGVFVLVATKGVSGLPTYRAPQAIL